MIKLDAGEINTIDRILDNLSSMAMHGKKWSLEGLTADWRQFVSEVESGYQLTIYDYTNDLAIRDLLENLLKELPSSIGKKIESYLLPVDQLFRSTTTKINKPLLDDGTDQNWWWYQIPIDPLGDLRTDLLAEGLID